MEHFYPANVGPVIRQLPQVFDNNVWLYPFSAQAVIV
jgi:hypothetical protein